MNVFYLTGELSEDVSKSSVGSKDNVQFSLSIIPTDRHKWKPRFRVRETPMKIICVGNNEKTMQWMKGVLLKIKGTVEVNEVSGDTYLKCKSKDVSVIQSSNNLFNN